MTIFFSITTMMMTMMIKFAAIHTQIARVCCEYFRMTQFCDMTASGLTDSTCGSV